MKIIDEGKQAMAKNVQIRFTDSAYEALSKLAEKRGEPMTAIIRDSIALYALLADYVDRGERLYFEDKNGKERGQLVITGLL